MNDFRYIERNFRELTDEVGDLAAGLGRAMPTVVAVTKSATDEELLALLSFGAVDIGENRPGEVKRRGELLRAAGYAPRMHEIGTLQRNKIKYIADSVHLIHSVDSLKLAEDISRLAARFERNIPVLIEVNSAREENKSGISPEECESLFLAVRELPNITVSGLMTMGPVCDDPEDIRPYFRETKQLFDSLSEKYGFSGTPTLSMGMSDSYRIAVEEGSTLIRVGRKLFKK